MKIIDKNIKNAINYQESLIGPWKLGSDLLKRFYGFETLLGLHCFISLSLDRTNKDDGMFLIIYYSIGRYNVVPTVNIFVKFKHNYIANSN